jgi:hypothetical protein
MRPGGRTALVIVIALTGLAATGKIALVETGPIAPATAAQLAGARLADPIARPAGQIVRLASPTPVRQVVSVRGRAGTTSPARPEAGMNGLLGGPVTATDGTMAARGRAAARTGVRGRPAGPTPGDAATGPAGPTGPTTADARPSAATTLLATAMPASGWTFPTRSPRTNWIPKPQPSCGPCRET